MALNRLRYNSQGFHLFKPHTKERIKDRLRDSFDAVTIKLERDHRDGLRILAKQALHHRLLIIGILAANLFAALFEGGTIGILGIAVSVLVENDTEAVQSRFGLDGAYITSLISEVGRGGLFLILVLVAVSAQIIKSGLTYLGNFLSIQLRFLVTKELQDMTTQQAMRLSYAEIGNYPAGVINATIGQSGNFAALIMIFNKLTLTVLMFLVYSGIMLVMSIPLTLSAIAVITVLGFALSGVIRKLRELGEKMASAVVATDKITFEFLQAPRLLRIFNATDFAERAIADTRERMLRATEKSQAIKAGVDPATDALTISGAGAFLIIGYLAAGESATSVIPSLLLFVFVLNRMMPQVKTFNQARMGFVNALPAVRRVSNFLRHEDKTFARRGGRRFSGLEREIYIENVCFRYGVSEVDALSGINFKIPKGGTVALVGSSGAGKSTLADLLLGLYDPTEGRILVDGADLRGLDLMEWRANIGVVDQEVLLLNTSVLNNITFSQKVYTRKDAENAAKAAYAHEFICALPNGYDTEIGDRGYRLSGGQQQRLALARALLRNPQILILDEATSALDTHSERIIQNTLENLRHERTMLVIAHRLSTLVRADNIVVLKEGRIAEQGTWNELMETNGIFAELWNMQAGGMEGA